jgi:hypothetical protein
MTQRYLITLFSQLKINEDHRHSMVLGFTSGRTHSTRSLKPSEMQQIASHLQELTAQKNKGLDKERKRLLAAVFGCFKLMKRDVSQDYVKTIACRAARVKGFNKIPPERLKSLYNAFINAQKDLDFAHRLVGGFVAEQQDYN